MSTVEASVYPTPNRVLVVDLVGSQASTDEFTWETRSELLRYARAKLGHFATTRLEDTRAHGPQLDVDLVASIDEIPY